MKKSFAIIVLLMLTLCFTSCSSNTEKPTVTNPQTSPTVKASSSEINTDAPVTFSPAFHEGEKTTLSRENSDYIISITENGNWCEGTSDCINDVIFTINGKPVCYHVSCCTFNDYSTEKCLKLTKNQAEKVNDMLGPLGYLYGENEDVQLSVEINPYYVKHGENFVLTAKATNNTGETIYVSLPTGTSDMHYEIRVKIEDESGKKFVDLDTQGKEHTDDGKIFSIENGETVTQVMNMSPGYLLDGSMYPLGEEIKYFPEGTYKGTATFIWHDSFNPETFEYDEEHRKTINFDVPVCEIRSDTVDSFR